MKQAKFFVCTIIALNAIFLCSCGSGDQKAADSTADTSTAKKDTVVAAAPVPSGPVLVMTITHKVANYAKWKPAYDSHDSIRLAHGVHNYVIARGIDDSNMVMVAMKMDDASKAKEMGDSKEMKERMKKAGVTGPVSIDYLESIVNDTTAILQTVRVMVKHKVKDWDAWKKSFDSHKQVRIDAGLTDRVVSHTVGDDHNVTVVFAVADVAKAKAFMKSKDLKDKMAEAGVDGPPTIFFYKIAQKY
jgi:hypothetical protein